MRVYVHTENYLDANACRIKCAPYEITGDFSRRPVIYTSARVRGPISSAFSLLSSLLRASPWRSLIDEVAVRESTRGKKHPVPPQCRNSSRASASNSSAQLIRRFELDDASSRSTGPNGQRISPVPENLLRQRRSAYKSPSFPSTRKISNGWRVYRPKAKFLSRKREDLGEREPRPGRTKERAYIIARLNELMETSGKLCKFFIESLSYNVDSLCGNKIAQMGHGTTFFTQKIFFNPFAFNSFATAGLASRNGLTQAVI